MISQNSDYPRTLPGHIYPLDLQAMYQNDGVQLVQGKPTCHAACYSANVTQREAIQYRIAPSHRSVTQANDTLL